VLSLSCVFESDKWTLRDCIVDELRNGGPFAELPDLDPDPRVRNLDRIELMNLELPKAVFVKDARAGNDAHMMEVSISHILI